MSVKKETKAQQIRNKHKRATYRKSRQTSSANQTIKNNFYLNTHTHKLLHIGRNKHDKNNIQHAKERDR